MLPLRLPYSSVCSRRESSDPRKGAQTKKVPTLLQELWQAKVLLHLRRGQREGGGHSATRAKEMQSTDRLGAGLSANTRLTSETQDLWNEVAHEAEFAERHNTRFKSYQQAANYHHAQLAALQGHDADGHPVRASRAGGATQPPTPSQHHTPPKPATVVATPVRSSPVNGNLASQRMSPNNQMEVVVTVDQPMTPYERRKEKERIKRELDEAEHERKLESERIARLRQQRINWYRRPRAEHLASEERKAARERLYKLPVHAQPREKSTTNIGHHLTSGELSPTFERAGRKYQVGRTPKSRGVPQQSYRGAGGGQMAHRGERPRTASRNRPKSAPISAANAAVASGAAGATGAAGAAGRSGAHAGAPGTAGAAAPAADGAQKKAPFEGLTVADYVKSNWRPSFTYRPAKQDKPWEELDGFSKSTRSLERRKMNPFADIQSFNSAGRASGYVRPLDVKGQLGAYAVQQWKESLREDFAQDFDNFSSNAHDANMDALRAALGAGTAFSKPKSQIQ